jgi:hypothetical protein
LTKMQPTAGLQPSSVQGLPSEHSSTPKPGTQAPSTQVSPVEQALPSWQPAVLWVWTHPLRASQLSSVQGLLSSQSRAGPPWQVPPPQVSAVVHGLASSQGTELVVKVQPSPGWQRSVVQRLSSLQVSAGPGRHQPLAHWSPTVHSLLSSQSRLLGTNWQPELALQLSVVHGLPSSQGSIPLPTQSPN